MDVDLALETNGLTLFDIDKGLSIELYRIDVSNFELLELRQRSGTYLPAIGLFYGMVMMVLMEVMVDGVQHICVSVAVLVVVVMGVVFGVNC